jgi:hypothetical protein
MLNLFLSEGTEEDEPTLPSYLVTLSHPSTTRITGLAAGQLPGKLNSELFMSPMFSMSQEVLKKSPCIVLCRGISILVREA